MISLLLFLTINYLVNIRLCKTSFALRYCTKYSIVFAICSPFTVTVTAQLITDLSVISKLLERHIHFLLTLHLDENDPISEQQWGYQQGKSTVDRNSQLAKDSGIWRRGMFHIFCSEESI